MKHVMKLSSLVVFAILVSVAGVYAQEWRGMGRVGGFVLDEETGQPLEGVVVKATLPTAGDRGPGETKSKKNGEWAVGGVARGEWAVDFSKDGYETRRISIGITEMGRIPPMEIKLKKKAAPVADPNDEIKEQLTQAAAMMNAKQYADARKIYEDLSAKHPEVKQFRPLIARTYYAEGNKKAAIEHLRKAAAEDPDNLEVKLLLGNTLMEEGQADEARQILASLDESKVTDPAMFLNAGIALVNERKHADAIVWFDKAVARFPQHADGYYYRGIANLSLAKTAEAKADLEKYVSMAPADAPELKTAKQILATIK
ncbi:MAG: tetratricopeptide repeat protein [Ornithinimicrobium sp.]|uniref:carboxypeptidase-like regulatory domain-containing protein n=1 Tax=Ornithinimicrobium sp. TaxID=1977084 RepID=UPI003D9BCA6B